MQGITPGGGSTALAIPRVFVCRWLGEMASSWQSLLVSAHGPPCFVQVSPSMQGPGGSWSLSPCLRMASPRQRWHAVCTQSWDTEALQLVCGAAWGLGTDGCAPKVAGSGRSELPLSPSQVDIWEGQHIFPPRTQEGLRGLGVPGSSQTWAQRLAPQYHQQGEMPGPLPCVQFQEGGPHPDSQTACFNGVSRSRPRKPKAAKAVSPPRGPTDTGPVPVFNGLRVATSRPGPRVRRVPMGVREGLGVSRGGRSVCGILFLIKPHSGPRQMQQEGP